MRTPSGKGPDPFGHVGQRRIVRLDPAEQLPRPGRTSGLLVEIGKGVGAPQMVRPGPRRQPPALLKHPDGHHTLEIATTNNPR